MPRTKAPIVAALAAISLGFAGGCSSPKATGPVEVAADRYAVTFDAARDVLRERRFDLSRVDSTSGVLTTEPSVSAGLFTPWSRDQQTFDDELDDTLNRQQRTVRVEFEPLEPPAPGQIDTRDMVARPQATRLEVRVTVERQHRTGQQPQPASIALASRWQDPSLQRRDLHNYAVTMRRDEALERKLIDEIMERASERQPQAEAAAPSPPEAAPSPPEAAPSQPDAAPTP